MFNDKVSPFYGSNKAIKKKDVLLKFTKENIEEAIKCEQDILYFFENYIYIVSLDEGRVLYKPYDYQKEIIKSCQDNRFNIFTLARQSGKCVRKDTLVLVRNKKTGEVKSIEMRDLKDIK